MKKETTEVATKQTAGDLRAAHASKFGGSADDNFTGDDLLIQKVLLMQPLSVFVASGAASPGQLVTSVDQKKLADKETELEVIPIAGHKTWKICKQQGSKWNYIQREPFTAQNSADYEAKGREWEEGGEKFRADLERHVYFMLKSEAKDPNAVPLLVTFTRSGTPAGKAAFTHLMMAQKERVAPFSRSMTLSSKFTKNNDGDQFYVFALTNKGERFDPTTTEYKICDAWYDTIKSGKAKVDDREDEGEPTTSETANAKSAHKF